jgi:hypothetical protein
VKPGRSEFQERFFVSRRPVSFVFGEIELWELGVNLIHHFIPRNFGDYRRRRD